MKLLTGLLVFVPLLFTNAADVSIDKTTADSIKTFTAHQFNEKAASLAEGQIVRLKFAYRSEAHDSKGEARCQVRDVNNGTSPISAVDSAMNCIDIRVPPEGQKWLNRVPTDHKSRASIIVYGRVVKGLGNSFEVRILGQQIQSDFNGTRVVWRE